MNKFIFSVLLVVLCVSVSTAINVASCWKDWNRCSPKTSAFTGSFAYDCNTFCVKCKKATGGKCVDAPSQNCADVLPNNKKCVCDSGAQRRSGEKGRKHHGSEKFSINPKCWGNAKALFF